MIKYKELLKEIICKKENINLNDFKKVDEIEFNDFGIKVIYIYYPYSTSSKIESNTCYIYNSELNAYIYENIN
jgi:hypothetical protein